MRLDFYESDVLAWFLREREDEFLQCADDFGYDEDAAKYLLSQIRGKIFGDWHRECERGAKQLAKRNKKR